MYLLFVLTGNVAIHALLGDNKIFSFFFKCVFLNIYFFL